MERVASTGVNATMESFFALLQTNVINAQPTTSIENLSIAINSWIKAAYRRRR